MAVAYYYGDTLTHVGQVLPQGLQFGLVPTANGQRQSTFRATSGKMVRGAATRGPGRAP
jgi:hypothetical protein